MPELTIEEAVNQSCGALMSGDITRVMSDFTPDALMTLMNTAGGINTIPSLLGYEIRSHDKHGDDHHFHIAFNTSSGDVTAKATWKEIDGLWKVTALSLDGI